MEHPKDIAEFARMIVDALETAHVEYMLGGSIAIWIWGEFRTTNDLDVVVNLTSDKLEPLSAELMKRNMMVPADIMQDNIDENRIDLPINAIHPFSGYKAELFPLRPDDDLRRSALSRRILADLGPVIGEVYLHSPEDLIVYKLIFYSISRQTKHDRDIKSILRSGRVLDMDYIRTWALRKNVLPIWEEILKS